ncbi:VanZ family protein [Halalkalibacter kiskunsagensis]|uniref:VanZ family protein n=1 Tax=Halalkalibacter kiskunsagensis TaxID=1548599 RepID=A0ABV6K9T3_9BACI
MNKWTKLVVFYWLPVLFVAAMIFTLSSQSYEQQDLRPYIGQVTDLERMKEMYNQIKMEHVEHQLYVEENGFKRTLQVIVEKWKLLVVLVGGLCVIALTITIGFLVKAARRNGYKKVLRALSIFSLLAVISIVLVVVGILFAFRIEEMLLMIKNRVAVGRAQDWLKGIQFMYAGNEISVQRLGADRFIEFLIRKAAHFSFFFVLGFLMYRALWTSGVRKRVAYGFALLFVLFYAISDEIHQAFTPNRTPLFQDVILDFSGGVTGVTLALCVYLIISHYQNKTRQNTPIIITSRIERRKIKG